MRGSVGQRADLHVGGAGVVRLQRLVQARRVVPAGSRRRCSGTVSTMPWRKAP
jgi:hypothetical protein